MTPFKRRLFKWAHRTHQLISLFVLMLLIFFAVTGFLLNHEDWVGTDNPRMQVREGKVPTALLKEPDKLAVVELLRKDFGAVGEMNSFEIEPDRLRVVFKRPGTRIDASILREDGKTEVQCETRGVVGMMLDLHRGKSTGFAWSLVIDLCCIALMAIAATGLILWWTLRGRSKLGIALIVAGGAFAWAIYALFVP